MAKDVIEINSNYAKAFGFLQDPQDPWDTLYDNIDKWRYKESDDLYDILLAYESNNSLYEKLLQDYCDKNGTKYDDIEHIRKEYEDIYNNMMPDVLESIARKIRNGEYKIKITI